MNTGKVATNVAADRLLEIPTLVQNETHGKNVSLGLDGLLGNRTARRNVKSSSQEAAVSEKKTFHDWQAEEQKPASQSLRLLNREEKIPKFS